MWNKIKQFVRRNAAKVMTAFALVATAGMAHATDVDPVTDVTAMATSATTLFNGVEPVVITVVLFGILIGIVKIVKKR